MVETQIKKRIDEHCLVLDINDFSDIQEIIEFSKSENKRFFVLNKIINARLLEHNIVLLKHQYFETIELYQFLFDENMTSSDKSIYQSMRTLNDNITFT